MKKSTRVTLTVVAAMGMAGCNRHRDPCAAASFDATACQDAVRSGGYFWSGHWHSMSYPQPYPFYYDAYRNHVSRGGVVVVPPAGAYLRPPADAGRRFGTGGSSSRSSGVTHGGFGSTGGGHSSGS